MTTTFVIILILDVDVRPVDCHATLRSRNIAHITPYA